MTNKYSIETKLTAVHEYLKGRESIRVIAQMYGVSKTELHRWIAKFNLHGEAAFQEAYTNYTIEFKMDVLNYISKNGASIEEATAVFNVSSSGTVRNWKRLFETQGIDALLPKQKEHIPMKKDTNKNQPVEGSEEALRAEIERLRMENAYLKKLRALIQEKERLQNNSKRK